jgi:hypothetical protein
MPTGYRAKGGTMIRRLVFILAVVAVPLALAATAAANTVGKGTRTFTYAPEDTGIVCGSGATAFDIFDSATVTRTDTNFFDNNGNFIRTLRHETSVGQLSNPLTRATLDYQAETNTTFVFATPQGDILTSRGEMNVTAPGHGVVLQNAGLLIDILGPDSETFIARGPHEELDYFLQGNAALVQKLCAVLGAP